MSRISVQITHYNIGSCTFAFGASTEVAIAGVGEDSVMSPSSSISSTRAFFETDAPPADLAGSRGAFCFVPFELFVRFWWAAGPRSATVLVGRLSAS